jgi:hypothetical protein
VVLTSVPSDRQLVTDVLVVQLNIIVPVSNLALFAMPASFGQWVITQFLFQKVLVAVAHPKFLPMWFCSSIIPVINRTVVTVVFVRNLEKILSLSF